MNEDDMVLTNSDFVVTETTLNPKVPLERVVALLRERKATGQLVCHVSQGGVQKVSLTEKTKATGKKSDQIRGVFGWEEK